MRITLDVGGYRTRREKILRELAQSVAKKVLDSGLRTADLSGGQRSLGTTEMTAAVVAAIEGA